MEDTEKYEVGAELTREDMAKLWSTENILGRDEREILVFHHRLNHCYLKSLLRLSKRGIIPRNISNIRKFPPCVTCLFGKSHKRPWRTKGKHSGGSIRKPSETRTGAINSIDQMVSYKPGLIPKSLGH